MAKATIEVNPMSIHIGAEIGGVDLSKPLAPETVREIRDALLAHYALCEALALALLRALCTALGVAPDALDACFTDHASFQRLNRYAPCPDPAPPDAPPLPVPAGSAARRGRIG